MRIGFITTSRADFGLYLPLLHCLRDRKHNLFIFAGGMHAEKRFGFSHQLIQEAGFKVNELVASLHEQDSPEGLAISMGQTTLRFARVWQKYHKKLDVLFVLGDRYEMFAAAAATLPFNIKLAHLHGGETTLGAIDNSFRHALTSMSHFHFTSHVSHSKRVQGVIGSSKNVHTVGALGVDNVLHAPVMSHSDFRQRFDFDLQHDFALMTYHPETVNVGQNANHADELLKAIAKVPLQVLCTLPNADTEGSVIRKKLLKYAKSNPKKLVCHENLTLPGYMAAMRSSQFLLGNTSSGLIEAASFHKPVVNIGDRQLGRLAGKNVIHCANKASEIIQAVKLAQSWIGKRFQNPYGDGETAPRITKIIEGLNV